MTLSDQEFREEYKPLQVPSAYNTGDTLENKILFALAQIGEGSVDEVITKLKELEPSLKDDLLAVKTNDYLKDKFNKGLLNGSKNNVGTCYNLNKITHANKGSVNPELLAPGLD